jgi:hypothetical protein
MSIERFSRIRFRLLGSVYYSMRSRPIAGRRRPGRYCSIARGVRNLVKRPGVVKSEAEGPRNAGPMFAVLSSMAFFCRIDGII